MSCLNNDKAQPAFIIAGLFVKQSSIKPLTRDFLSIKQKFNPKALPATARRMDWVRQEIKGNDLRREVSDGSHRQRRFAIGFLDNVLRLLEQYGVRIVARVWIKEIGVPVNQVSIYSHSVQYICEHFENCLGHHNEFGYAILDSRRPHENINVSHSIFTQKHKATGDAYPHLVEAPAFGHSDNHAGLQLADAMCSALLWPMAMHAYCEGCITNLHVRSGYWRLAERYGERIKRLQHRYQDGNGRYRGGINVSDRIGKQPGAKVFRASPPSSVMLALPAPAAPTPPPTPPPTTP